MGSNFNIQDFISRFDDMIPYEVEVIIGGNLANNFREDETQICRQNYRGKMYPVYDKSAEGNNIISIEYKPAQELSLPIQILVKTNPAYAVVIESQESLGFRKNITHTNKVWTRHTARLISSNNKQVGCIMVDLNQSGDVTRQTCFYESYTGKHEIMHSFDIDTVASDKYGVKSKKFRREEHTSYTERYLEFGTETTVDVYRVDGVVTCITIRNKKTETQEEIMFQSVTNVLHNSNNPGGMLYLTRSVFNPKKLTSVEMIRSSWESRVINKDLSDKYGIFFGFLGNYSGHTFIMGTNYSSLCIHSQEGGYNIYTPIDVTGTDPFKDTSSFDEIDYDCGGRDDKPKRDERYLSRVRYADKTPLFITKKDESGKETLVGYKGIIFEEYKLYRGVNIRNTLGEITKNGYHLSESQEKAFGLLIKLRDLKLTSPDESTVMDNLEEIALKEFEPFEEQYITPFVPIPDIKPIQLIKK